MMSPALIFFNPFYLCNVDRVFCMMYPAAILTSAVWPVDAGEILQYNDLPDFVMSPAAILTSAVWAVDAAELLQYNNLPDLVMF